jgi:sialate O-acetylesterase
MKTNFIRFLVINLLFTVMAVGGRAQATLVLPAVFSDNMVLQQKTNAAVWGKTGPGKMVKVSTSWNAKTYAVKADQKGNWKVMVTTPSYGGPYRIDISDGKKISLKNVLIGEVWICSGQSNMEMPLAGWGNINNYKQEIANAKYPNIRLLQVEHGTSNQPLGDAKVRSGGWQPCSPQSIPEFSSVAYFFARELYKKTGVPIGLIHSSWGGTVAEAWTSGTALGQMPDFAEAVKKIESSSQEEGARSYRQEMETWTKEVLAKDQGYNGGKPLWSDTTFDASSWDNMLLPGLWEEQSLPDFDGVVWFRKEVVIPESWTGKDVKLNLGTIDDNDITFFDGQKIGETEGYMQTRSYMIPAVKPGKHVLAVRVFDGSGGGGIYGSKNVLSLSTSTGDLIALDGNWQYKVALNLKDITVMPVSDAGPNRPSVLYNAMIHPFTGYAIRGAIWYQGESNADRADQYRELFPALITDWRKQWKQGDFPFYFVQLANFNAVSQQQSGVSAWAELRDAQLNTLKLPNTGMSVTIDIGEAKNIHPKNKQEVGHRLALIAMAKTYGSKIPCSGPVMQSYQIQGENVNLKFKFADKGLKVKDGTVLKGFIIAGEDQKFYWADAVIQGDEIIVHSDDVARPVAVRYAWADDPECNLYNEEGLPASPFRTDDWKGSTYGKK